MPNPDFFCIIDYNMIWSSNKQQRHGRLVTIAHIANDVRWHLKKIRIYSRVLILSMITFFLFDLFCFWSMCSIVSDVLDASSKFGLDPSSVLLSTDGSYEVDSSFDMINFFLILYRRKNGVTQRKMLQFLRFLVRCVANDVRNLHVKSYILNIKNKKIVNKNVLRKGVCYPNWDSVCRSRLKYSQRAS